MLDNLKRRIQYWKNAAQDRKTREIQEIAYMNLFVSFQIQWFTGFLYFLLKGEISNANLG